MSTSTSPPEPSTGRLYENHGDEARGVAPGRGRLIGRHVMVVGAGSEVDADSQHEFGNGRATAVLAAREGASVIAADRDVSLALKTVALIERESGEASAMRADVTSADDCEALFADTTSKQLDGLVLNVGISQGRALGNTSLEEWEHVIDVNLTGHFRVIRQAMNTLADGASVVFISSVAGLLPGTFAPAYDASKAGLMGLCRHVALEGGRRGIRANIVAPGLIDSPLGQRMERERTSRSRLNSALRRHGTPWEVAYAVLFLLSCESSYISGQLLVVDGGLAWMR